MRLLADENVARPIIERLRMDGHDVLAIAETRPGISDHIVLEEAAIGDRLLVTEDRDFGELVIRQRLRVGGIVLLEVDQLSLGAQIRCVAECIGAHGDMLEGNLLVIEPSRTRIRPLPERG
jgi:predicted nuclease of predicted toxin-antitoxin system